jgi:hypothetical protein
MLAEDEAQQKFLDEILNLSGQVFFSFLIRIFFICIYFTIKKTS